MPKVQFTQALKRFFPELSPLDIAAKTIPELLQLLDDRFPGIKSYIVSDSGSLRQHVNIFLDGEMIEDREQLSDSFNEASEIYFMQALSGG